MSQQTFKVSAFWDEEAGVYCSDSNIDGLHAEAKTLDEFWDIVQEYALDLIIANHIKPQNLLRELARIVDGRSTPGSDGTGDADIGASMRELIPTIVWDRSGARR